MSFQELRHYQNKSQRLVLEKQKAESQRVNLTNKLIGMSETEVAAHNISFSSSHHASMRDALTQVRKDKTSHPDGTHMMPSNHGGRLL